MLEEQIKETLAGGADGYLRKPVVEEELFEALRHALNGAYVYTDEQLDEANPKPVQQIEPAQVRSLPDSIRLSIQKSVLVGDVTSLQKLAEEVVKHDQILGEAMLQKLEIFDLETIGRWFPH